jgi:hypothetical protein
MTLQTKREMMGKLKHRKVQIELRQTKRTDDNLILRMKKHYTRPKGFVGRSICYAIFYKSNYYGHIVAGSATRFLPNRNEFLGITIKDLNCVINNVFFNVSRYNGSYPIRNFTSSVVKRFVNKAQRDWKIKYGDTCVGFETLVQKPRKGELYLRAGWTIIGETKGYTCKRISGKGTDTWTGKRVWNTNPDTLKPKLVLCYKCLP